MLFRSKDENENEDEDKDEDEYEDENENKEEDKNEDKKKKIGKDKKSVGKKSEDKKDKQIKKCVLFNDVNIPIVNNEISIKYRQVVNKGLLNCTSVESNDSRRGKERTIKEAIFLVHKWKECLIKPNGGMISLEEAAYIINTPKKTLDDYYRQLRDGLKKKFDFAYYRDYPIGILRRFNSCEKFKKE